MGKHLSEPMIQSIVGLLDGWTGSLTWTLVCKAVEGHLGIRPVRQTLAKNADVSVAFHSAKKRINEAVGSRATPSSLRMAAERIHRLESEIKRLEESNRRLLERFIVWQYNAYAMGMTDRDLDNELPSIDRGATDVEAPSAVS